MSDSKKSIAVVIPARYQSTRFPGKPLVQIQGKEMILHVCEKAVEANVGRVIVATDHELIYNCVSSKGYEVYYTKNTHISGTDRCAEVLDMMNQQGYLYDYLINLQGDEPFIQKEQIQLLAHGLEQNKVVTLCKKINRTEADRPDVVKVVFSSANGEALYFSRSLIPYYRDPNELDEMYWKHIGIYGFDSRILREISRLEAGDLEKKESLEQLRWLEASVKLKMVETTWDTKAIDRPEDLFGI